MFTNMTNEKQYIASVNSEQKMIASLKCLLQEWSSIKTISSTKELQLDNDYNSVNIFGIVRRINPTLFSKYQHFGPMCKSYIIQ